MFVTNWISTTKIQKISEITNFFRHYFLSRTEVYSSFSKIVCHPAECAFSARTYLYHIFKEKTGKTPTEWRTKCP